MRARDHGILRAFPLALSALLLMGCGSGGGTAADTFAEASPDVLVETSPETAADALDDPDADLALEPADDVPADVPAPDASDAAEAADTPDADGTEPEVEAVRLFELETPVALTPDGRTALLWTYTTGEFALADTVTGEVASKGTVGEPQRNVPTALSPALHVTALHGEPVQGGLWSEAAGWRDLGTLFDPGCINDPGPPVLGDLSSAWDVSDDGRVVVGMAWDGCTATQAFRWTDGDGGGVMTGLAVLGKVMEGSGQKAPYNRATVVSADGRVAAGFAQNGAVDRSPALWNEDGTGFLLDPTDETNPGEVKAINADGTLVAGDWSGKGFTWTAGDGVVRFAAASEADSLLVNAMTADGARLFGTVQTFDPDLLQMTYRAYVWSPHDGVRLLDEVATASGLALPEGSTLINVLSVSSDGRVILGTLTLPNPDPMGWPLQKSVVLRLPLP